MKPKTNIFCKPWKYLKKLDFENEAHNWFSALWSLLEVGSFDWCDSWNKSAPFRFQWLMTGFKRRHNGEGCKWCSSSPNKCPTRRCWTWQRGRLAATAGWRRSSSSSASLLSPVSSVVSVEQSLSPVWSINSFLIILLCGLLTKVLSYYPPVSSRPSSQRET